MKEKSTKKSKAGILSLLLMIFSVNVFSQIEQPEVKFYVNNGTKEVTSLECYDFDNLMIKFKTTALLFGSYESVDFVIKKIVKTGDEIYFTKSFNPSVLKAAFSGKQEIVDWVFSSSDTKGLSDYKLDDVKFDRIGLQYSIEKKNVEGTKLEFYVIGYTVTGYKEEYSGNSVYKRPIYENTEITKSGFLEIKNRIYIDNEAAKKSNRLKSFIPGGSVFAKDKDMKVPDDVVKTGTCFPADPNASNSSANVNTSNNNSPSTPPATSTSNSSTGGSSTSNVSNKNTTNTSVNGTNKNTTNTSVNNTNTSNKTSTSSNNTSNKDGLTEEKYPNGIVKSTGAMKNGVQVGTWKYFNQTGNFSREENYNTKGELEGQAIEYSSTGEVTSKSEYKGGKLNGKVLQFNKGSVQYETNYIDGKKNGHYVKYKPDGSLIEDGYYKNGIKDGEWKTYDSTGKLKETKKFKDGMPQQ